MIDPPQKYSRINKPFNNWIIILSISFLFITGCASKYYVPISHVIPSTSDDERRYEPLRHVYLLIVKPAPKHDISLKVGSEELPFLRDRFDNFDALTFANSINKNLYRFGGSVVAYRVTSKHPEEDPFIKELKPTGIIEIRFNDIVINTKEVQREVRGRDGKGKTTVSYTPKWVSACVLNMTIKLYDRIEERTIYKNNLRVVSSHEFNSAPSEGKEEEIMQDIFVSAAGRAIQVISPLYVVRKRPIFKTPDDEDSKKAYKLAKRDKWEEAEEIWKARLESDKGNWQDKMNLGIASELKRDNALAIKYYKEAEKESKNDKKSSCINWSLIYEDLATSIIKTSKSPPAVKAWFKQRLAVLPFSDETVSVEAPLMIRTMVYKLLDRGGYNVMPLEEVDKLLRKYGISQGGQLRSVTPEEVSKWLDADWILYGHLKDFNKINIGIYVKKSIKGNLSLWDATDGREFWSSDRSVIVHSVPPKVKKDHILAHFLANIAESWIGALTNKPMGKEALTFALNNIEDLPLEPTER